MNKNLNLTLLLLISFNLFAAEPDLSDYEFIVPELKPIDRPSTRVDESLFKRLINPYFLTASTPNWAGYVASTNIFSPTPGTVSFVGGSWIIPTIAKAQPGTYYAIWVGIDGFNNGTIEQLGTAYQFTNGRQINYAWFEMYPKVSMQITNFPVKPKDSISASVTYLGSGKYKLTMTNHTTKKTTTIPQFKTINKSSPRTCCEWIVEAPSLSNILPLAHFNPATLFSCKAKIKGISGVIRNPNYQNLQLNMANSNGTVKAVTSSLNSAGNSFKVTWKHN